MLSKAFLAGFVTVFSLVGVSVAAQAPTPSPTYVFDTSDPACQAATLVSTGGKMPRDSQTLAIRWTGYANYELVYNGQVILLDAAFDRGSNFPPLGFKAADVKKADAILIGHGHGDHMSDAASVAAQTGAMVVGAPVTTEKLLTQSVAPKQLRTVTGRGGELLELRGVSIEPILGRHSVRQTEVTVPFETALRAVTPPLTPEQRAEQAPISRRGVNDPRLTAEGTITYVLTFASGFSVLFRDSAGDITEFERAAMKRIGRVDVAINALSANVLNTLTAQKALDYVRVYRPGVFMPAHHDAPYNDLWRATEPIFQVLKDEDPGLLTISRGYREPVCFNTKNHIGRTR